MKKAQGKKQYAQGKERKRKGKPHRLRPEGRDPGPP
jgi:hypothetical protein